MTKNVLEYLEWDATELSDKIAVIDENKQYSYRELYNLSKIVGSDIAKEIKKNTPVMVFMEKGADTLCTFFGILYAGGFYTLLNPELPESRLNNIYDTLASDVVVTSRELKERAEAIFKTARILLIEELLQGKSEEDELKARLAESIDTEPLYINFTSGSTGIPKGIVVSQRSVIDFIEYFTDIFNITDRDILANQAPFDFDVSVKDIYGALKTGATLVIVPKRMFSSPVELIDYLCKHNITTMIWAVSALCLISTFHGLDYKTPKTVNKVLFSGEVMPKKHLEEWMSHLKEAQFVNLYGPTEITCNCTYHFIDRNREYSEAIPIGKSFPNEDVFLLDENNQKISDKDIIGEICVRGTALALGYYSAGEQNEKHFIQNPLNPYYPETIYLTGDLAKYNDDQELVFCGRKDFQIKYMGHRIEIEEIERAMSEINGVESCCVVFDEAKSKLKGFYIGAIDKKELSLRMKETLPVFMIPSALRQIEKMPLTKNGKIDRKLLKEMKGGSSL